MTNEEIIKARVDVDRRLTDALDILMAQVTKPKEKLVTPDGIWFTTRGIVFPNKKQALLYDAGVYKVHSPGTVRRYLPLTPCEWGDLKPGDVFVGTRQAGITKHTALCWYRIKLDELRSVYIDAEDITIETSRYNYIYKVGL